MEYSTSPEHSRVGRFIVRAVILAGAVVAVWILAPAAAADELPTPPNDAVSDSADAVTAGATDAVSTDTEAAAEATEVADEATETAAEVADETASTSGHAAENVRDAPDAVESTQNALDAGSIVHNAGEGVASALESTSAGVGSIVENAGDGAAVVGGRLQDPLSTVDLQDVMPAVEAMVGSVTPFTPTAPPIDGDQEIAGPGGPGDVGNASFTHEPSITYTGASLGAGPVAAGTPGAAAGTSSSGTPSDTLPTRDGLPPAVGPTAHDTRGSPSFDDLAAILAASMIALGLVGWFRHQADTVYSSVFLSLAERPG